MEDAWPLNPWPFPARADALAQALSCVLTLPAFQPGCPGTFCPYVPGRLGEATPLPEALAFPWLTPGLSAVC